MRASPWISRTPWLASRTVSCEWRWPSISRTRRRCASMSRWASWWERPMPSMRREKVMAPPVAIMALDGMQSQRWAAPPMTSRSTRVTSAPRRAAWVAAEFPAGPPPMMTKRTAIAVVLPLSRRLVHAEDVAQCVTDLAKGRLAPERVLHRIQQVLGAASGVLDVLQTLVDRRLVSCPSELLHPGRLAPLHVGVDGKHLGRFRRLLLEAVDADDDLLAVVDGFGPGEGRLLDLVLHVTGLDGGHGAAHAGDLLDVAPGLGLDLVGEALDEVRPRKRVDGVGRAGLVGQDLLGAEGELGRLLGGQAG